MGGCGLPLPAAKKYAVALAGLFDFDAAKGRNALEAMPRETQIAILEAVKEVRCGANV